VAEAGDPARPAWRLRAKRMLAGRMAAALWRLRRAPVQVLRAERAERADRRAGRIHPPGPRRREVQSVFCFAAGPGSGAALLDSIESVLASDGEAGAVLVVDDASVDAREAVVRERFPGAEVIRRRRPSGGPPNVWPLLAQGIEHALERYDFRQWVKMDTDALVCGPAFSAVTLERWDQAPGAGLAGSWRVRCDGAPEDHAYHAEVLSREMRGDRLVAAAVSRAEAQGWRRGEIVQGGTCCVTREACDALVRQGWTAWRRPWHSAIAGDAALSLFVRAAGFEFLSLGHPQGIVAIANKRLPLAKEEIADGPWVAAHSVRCGSDGESEAELREFFRARRAEWRDARG